MPAINTILEDEPDAFIEITPDFNTSSSNLNIDIRTTFLNDLSGDYKISVYLIESGIIGAQKDGSDTILDYEFNHVLRAVLNTTYGEALVSDPIADQVETYSISNYDCSGTDWVFENMEVVAFIHRSDDDDSNKYEVIQAEAVELIE